MNTQELVLQAIKDLAAKHGLEAEINRNYANCGQMVFRKGWKTKANLRFDFQSTYFTIQMNRGETKVEVYSTPPPNAAFFIENIKGSEIEKCLKKIGALLS